MDVQYIATKLELTFKIVDQLNNIDLNSWLCKFLIKYLISRIPKIFVIKWCEILSIVSDAKVVYVWLSIQFW